MPKLFPAALAFAFALPSVAFACPGSEKTASLASVSSEATSADPASCAKKAELVGGACSYSTGMMAQRVLSEGKPWSFSGTLAQAAGDLSSHVAAPFTVGPNGTYVIANEVLDALTASRLHQSRVSLQGRALEVDGVRYFVLTSFSALNS